MMLADEISAVFSYLLLFFLAVPVNLAVLIATFSEKERNNPRKTLLIVSFIPLIAALVLLVAAYREAEQIVPQVWMANANLMLAGISVLRLWRPGRSNKDQ